MNIPRPALVASALLVGLLAGCIQAERPGDRTSTSEAAPPSHGLSTGSIAGVIVDEELMPIPGVQVAIIETRAVTTTDAAGAFTFNDVEPGSYRLALSSLGYQDAGVKVTVASAEVTYVNLTMKLLVIKESYQFTIPRSSFVKFGQWTVNHFQQTLNQSLLNDQLCSDCWHVLVLQKGIAAAQTELTWVPSITTPVTNQRVGVGIARSYGDGQLTSYFLMHDFSNGQKLAWPADDIDEVKGGAKIRVNVQGPGTANPGIVVQQKVDVYNTFAVGQDIPPTFSALPPK